MRPRIFLTGRTGQIGHELESLLATVGDVTAFDHHQLDFLNHPDLRRAVKQARPHAIVNTAAYTAVDQAESNESAARAINTDAPRVLAEEAQKLDALLVHYSTDYVFDGLKCSPYQESDPTNPINVYGRTKLAGEQAIREIGGRYWILRTAWIYSTRGRNFLLTILRLASEREELKIVHDQTGAPTWCREVARATTSMLESFFRQERPSSATPELNGTYHVTASGSATWFDFAEAILDEAQKAPTNARWLSAATSGRPLVARRVVPIESKQYPTAARRPPYSVLANDLLYARYGIRLPDWRDQLRAAFRSQVD